MSKPIYFTICSQNYLSYALTLGRSLRAADPDAEFLIFLADAPLEPGDDEGIEFETISACELGHPFLADMALRYSIMEFNTAIKPPCFKFLFETRGIDSAIYLDPDIYVLNKLKHVEDAISRGSSIVLTPHSLHPLDDGFDPDDLRLLRTGTFNLGFVAFANTTESNLFLDWWDRRLLLDCRVALDDGVFVDQKWVDLAPSYLSAVTILRHPGYNAAYWNLASRPIEKDGSIWRADGQRLYFFHFSGVVPGNGTIFSKHQNRFTVHDIGDLQDLLQYYLHQLDLNGHGIWSRQSYKFALPADMKGIDTFARSAYRRIKKLPEANIEFDPTILEAICNEPTTAIPKRSTPVITNLTYEIWSQRADLKRLFDLSRRDDRERFNAWLLTSGLAEHHIPSRFLIHLAEGGQSRSFSARVFRAVLKRQLKVKPIIELLPNGVRAILRKIVQVHQRYSSESVKTVQTETCDLERVPLAVYGYFNAETGLGQAVRSEFRAVRSAGIPAVARNLNAASFENREPFEFHFDTGETDAAIHLIHVNADQTLVSSDWAGSEVFDESRYRIGYWAWELEKFPSEWVSAIEKVDEIWVPSNFVARGIASVTGKPVRVFPHPVTVVNSNSNISDNRRFFSLPEHSTIFLSIFDFNSFSERKNPQGVLDAYEAAKREVSDLTLVLKCHGGQRHDRARNQIFERARRIDGVHIIDRVLDSEAMSRLYSACDCLVSLHRSEGFGLTICEAMGHGKPVIATDYSGSTDFFNAEVGEPIPCELVPVPLGCYPFAAGARWAQPDINAASEAMVKLSRSPELCKRKGEAGRARVLDDLSAFRIGQAMAARLGEILQSNPASRNRV